MHKGGATETEIKKDEEEEERKPDVDVKEEEDNKDQMKDPDDTSEMEHTAEDADSFCTGKGKIHKVQTEPLHTRLLSTSSSYYRDS